MLLDDFLYKAQTKQICHITAGKVNYHMTQISTNNKHLLPGISSNFADVQPCPQHIFSTSHWLPNCRGPLFQLSHWSPEHMAHYNFPLLIIIPGIHSLACLNDDKITHYPLLDFVEIYFPIHCYIISIFSLYFHVHILCVLYKTSST